MARKVYTRKHLLNLLAEEAKKYHREALLSIGRNQHMNVLSKKDLKKLNKGGQLTQRLIDALLVDFINYVGTGQCLDYGLYVKDLKPKVKFVLHHDDPPCTARLNDGFCQKCHLRPDMQSTCLYLYCPSCNRRLKKLKCPKCGQAFKHPN